VRIGGHVVSRDRRPVVALVTDAVYPYHCGGKELRYHELVSRLGDRAELHVYTMNWWRGRRERQTETATFHAVCRFHPLYSGGRRSITQAVFFAVGCLRLITCRFDVLEADHMPYLQILVLRLVAAIRRKRLVVTWHEVWGNDYWRQYLGAVGLFAWLLEWLAMRVPDHIIAASSQTADRLRATAGVKLGVTVAPNGIDLDTIRSCQPAGEPTDIAFVGRLIENKRVHMLLDAVAMLRASGQPVTCRIIGDGPDKAALHAQAERRGIADAVEFRHDVRAQQELYGLLKTARVFAFPSAREGFGIAVLEAIACGLPVVTTSAPDNLARHLVARTSRGVVCESSAAALADALRQVLAKPQAAPAAVAQEPWITEFGWDATAAAVAEALRI
jgi:glycosyltransferase involved in cell wall biosynthesis